MIYLQQTDRWNNCRQTSIEKYVTQFETIFISLWSCSHGLDAQLGCGLCCAVLSLLSETSPHSAVQPKGTCLHVHYRKSCEQLCFSSKKFSYLTEVEMLVASLLFFDWSFAPMKNSDWFGLVDFISAPVVSEDPHFPKFDWPSFFTAANGR